MSAAPAAAFVLALGAELGWPAVTLGRRTIATEVGWKTVLLGVPPLAPAERWILVRVLRRHLLVSTPGGRARLRRWIDGERANPATPTPRWLEAEWVRAKVLYCGDPSMLPAVVEGLGHLPRAVQAVALREIVFFGVGKDSIAWMGPLAVADRDGHAKRIVNLCGASATEAELARRVRHETAHAWLARVESDAPLKTVAGDEGVRALALAEHWSVLARVDLEYRREELLATAMELCWAPADDPSPRRITTP